MIADDLVWPPDFTHAPGKIGVALEAASRIARSCAQRRVVVQAGGCAGLWPRALAVFFSTVYTFEPDAANFRALVHNCPDPRVFPLRAALGAVPGTSGLARDKPQAGRWALSGDGPVPVLTLDSLAVPACDALVLDVEGSEAAVLRGAARTIATHRPVIWLEYLRDQAVLAAWLADHGYTPPEPGLGSDVVSRPRSPVLTAAANQSIGLVE